MIQREAKLRLELARRLRREVPDALWNYLVEKFYVQETLDGEKTVLELVQDVRELLAAAGQRSLRRRGPRMVRRDPAEAGTNLRQGILSELVALRAQNDPVVTDYRERFLPGGPISPADIENWIEIQMAADGTRDWIALALPPGHRCIYDVDNPYRPAVVPPWETTITEAVEHGRWPTLTYGLPDEEEEREVPISAGGTLEELARVSEFLSETYCWTHAQAVVFVLTGETPRLTRIRQAIRYRLPQALTRITLEIDLALSPREVSEWYGMVRAGIVGSRHREQSDKHLRLAEFAARRPVGEKWRASKTRWNTAFPAWSYSGVRNFERDAKAAVQRLVEPNYEMPTWVFEEE